MLSYCDLSIPDPYNYTDLDLKTQPWNILHPSCCNFHFIIHSLKNHQWTPSFQYNSIQNPSNGPSLNQNVNLLKKTFKKRFYTTLLQYFHREIKLGNFISLGFVFFIKTIDKILPQQKTIINVFFPIHL